MATKTKVQRLPAEQMFQKEINALIAAEKDPVPTGWKMSPRSVLTYITGGKAGKTTALAVNSNTYPTHIAGLPVAVNICCHVNRHAVREL